MATDLSIDDYAPLSFQAEGRRGNTRLVPADRSAVAPTWIDDENRSRLEAYKFLAALIGNVGRIYQSDGTDKDRKDRREYGDAALLVEAALNALFGDEIAIVVEDADKSDGARKRQDELDQWARDEGFMEKLFEGEWDAIGMGDTVFTLGWSNRKKRTRLRVYDPGFYFPVLSDDADDDFPGRLHLAWEFDETKPDGTKERRVRRITWELATDDNGDAATCLLSEGTWAFDAIGDRRQDTFDESKAVWETNGDGEVLDRLDLGQDWIPVIHIPNTPASQTHFGKSLLLYVAQLLWDIAGLDTDIEKAAETTATPILGVEADAPVAEADYSGGYGENGSASARPEPEITVEPGAVFWGKLTAIDLSAGVRALLEVSADRRKLLSVNAQLPAEVLGHVSTAEVASGLLFGLSFGPLRRLVRKMRLVRERKGDLLLKFVQRQMTENGAWPDKKIYPAHIAYGSFLPTDRKAVIDEVVELVMNKIITAATGLQLLVDEGVLDVDVAEEVAALGAADAAAAARLLDQVAASAAPPAEPNAPPAADPNAPPVPGA